MDPSRALTPCVACGAPLSARAAFCANCGAAASRAAPPPPPAPQSASYGPPPPAPYGALPARGGRSKAVIVVVLAIVILAGVGIAAFSFIGGGDQLGACVEGWEF